MKTISGDLSIAFIAREDLAIQGTLYDGLTVEEGHTLFLYGNLRGSLVIETAARLVLAGTLGAFVDRNDGTLSVAGEIATPIETIPGVVNVASDTAVTINTVTQLVGAEGRLNPVAGVTDISLSRMSILTWDQQDRTFTPTTSRDFVDLSTAFWPATEA
ncbi:hypothetical protein ITJ64_05550 [Herbiconiux sp. VKM Ac-1786]|uniref:hypothetical protein n=1 Tax=Herbiconiux sp. VKM Ac-1786 TaxID=2783824 RepID=UPI00188D2845|nr:hypothetical protein [Herbiconiux sp. VKM Ac-1786]MBF4571977.1 hypothetical protein [Herbiconiux sp. VKM Ac-1786]